MSRAWKPLPTHLPGWNAYQPEYPKKKETRKQKRLRFRAKKRSRFSARKSFPRADTQPQHPLPDLARTMIAELPTGNAQAKWWRKHGTWKCVAAESPIDWFTRLRHPEQAYQWLMSHHIPFHWIPIQKGGTAPETPPQNRPAEAYTPSKASAPSGDNTTAPVTGSTYAGPVGSISAVLEQNDVTSPRCLIDRLEPEPKQTDHRCH